MSKAAELANLIGNINAGGGSGPNKNLIINGNFVVGQRGTSFSNVTSSQFCLDRFSVDVGGGGAFNVTQDTSAPEGFEKSLKLEVNTADSSIAVGDAYRITQGVEGQNIAQIELGASTAKPMALSFYVKSSVTGTYGVGLANSAETENFVAEYTISSANTWEKKTINIPVRTSGTWLTTNGVGIGVRFDLGSGTNYNGTAGQWQTTSSKVYRTSSCVNLIATGSATWFITGIQLEIGQNPTAFEHEPFAVTLEKCYRYFQNNDCGTFVMQIVRDSDDIKRGTVFYPVRTRSNSPSVTLNTTTLDGATLAIDEARNTACSITMDSGSDGNVPRLHVYLVEDEI